MQNRERTRTFIAGVDKKNEPKLVLNITFCNLLNYQIITWQEWVSGNQTFTNDNESDWSFDVEEILEVFRRLAIPVSFAYGYGMITKLTKAVS